VGALLNLGFERVRCSVRRSSDLGLLQAAIPAGQSNRCQIVEANLLSKEECRQLTADVELVYHLVAGRGKSFPGCFQGSVITTRNLLDSLVEHRRLKRFVNVSSFAVYSRFQSKHGALWDESCPLEDNLDARHDPYAYGKLKQDELVQSYQERFGVPVTIVRPGIVFGPGKKAIPGFVGIDTFGFFMHLGGGGHLPLTYVDNCAEAIVLAGVAEGADGEVFNVVDDELPTSRAFLRAYKRQVRKFTSVPIPYPVTYGLCALWEWYAKRSKGQLPAVFNRRECAFAWKGHRYSNRKLK
jgi:nucleoside-diphosphate-sugar epimerase